MDPFINDQRRWPADTRLWHVYATPNLDHPDNHDLAALLAQTHTALNTPPLNKHISPVPPQWLHTTLRKLSLTPQTISPQDRTALVNALQTGLVELPATTVYCTPTTNQWSTLLHIDDPDRLFEGLHTATEHAVRTTLGPDALRHKPANPHLTTGYCTSTTDTAPYQHATHTGHAVPWHVDTLILADVIQDAHAHQYRWTTLATLNLAESR